MLRLMVYGCFNQMYGCVETGGTGFKFGFVTGVRAVFAAIGFTVLEPLAFSELEGREIKNVQVRQKRRSGEDENGYCIKEDESKLIIRSTRRSRRRRVKSE